MRLQSLNVWIALVTCARNAMQNKSCAHDLLTETIEYKSVCKQEISNASNHAYEMDVVVVENAYKMQVVSYLLRLLGDGNITHKFTKDFQDSDVKEPLVNISPICTHQDPC